MPSRRSKSPALLVALTLSLVLAPACSDPASPSQVPGTDAGDSGVDDVRADADLEPDAARDTAVPDVLPDTTDAMDAMDATDAEDIDATQDVAEDAPPPPTLAEPVELGVAGAERVGEDVVGVGEGLVVGPGSAVAWEVELGEAVAVQLEVEGLVWRHEGTSVRVVIDGQPQAALAWDLYGARSTASLVPAQAAEGDDFGLAFLPSPLVLSLTAGRHTLRLEPADTGGITVFAVRLVPLGTRLARPLDARPVVASPTGLPTIEVTPCEEPGCDDGARIQAAIASVEGPVHVVLGAGRFVARTSIVIDRDRVWLGGQGAESTTLLWSPASGDGGWRGAVEILGGPSGSASEVVEPVEAHRRRVVVGAGAEVAEGDLVVLTADDFGEVPALCVGGRDVERWQRHIEWRARVVEVRREAERMVLSFDRQLDHSIPLDAHPRVVVARSVYGAGIHDMTIEGDCPEARDIPPHTQMAADCTNSFVLEHSAARLQGATGAVIADVEVRHFGRFGVYATSCLETTVIGGGMALPADYGGGGAGYGVHAVRSGRTLVFDYEVRQARHGVVTDFGSTETQVVASRFSRCTLAALDIHGEASLDTLLLGNTLTDDGQGIIVGGGGREVHCNDGPRHHMVGNHLERCALPGVAITDYSRQIRVERNTILGSLVPVVIDAGSRDVELWRNRIEVQSGVGVQVLGAREGTGDVRLRDNRFVGAPPGWTFEPGLDASEEGSSWEP